MSDEDEQAMAERDAETSGLGFLVDGKRVRPERVSIIWRSDNKGETWTPNPATNTSPAT